MLLVKNKIVRQVLAVLETGNFLFLKLLLKNPAAARNFPGEVFRSYMSLIGEDRWACKSVFELFPNLGKVRAVIEHVPSEVILTPLEQLACLALITRAITPRSVFEIGTFTGRTALNFALNSPDDCTVYTLDLPAEARSLAMQSANAADARIIRYSSPGTDYGGKDVATKIKQLYGDSTLFDFSPFYGRIDLVYIDGAHHYVVAKNDTKNALRMVRPGGYILWDEFANYGDYNDVTRAVLDVVGADQIVQIQNTQLAVYRQPAG